MLDNLLTATNTTRTSLTNLKKKLAKIRIQVDDLGADLEKIDTKFENVLTQSEIYKSKLEREMGREVRRLEKELALLRKSTQGIMSPAEATESDLKVASTIGVFDVILRTMCKDAEDFRLASEAFLFPAVYERVMDGTEEAYFLDEVPPAALLVIKRGKEHVEWLRSESDTYVTDPDTWAANIDYVTEWWRNDALPLLYGARDEQWEIDMPLSLTEMLLWKEEPAARPLNFPRIYDAYEIYRKNKEKIYATTGLRDFELKVFNFEDEKSPQPVFGRH